MLTNPLSFHYRPALREFLPDLHVVLTLVTDNGSMNLHRQKHEHVSWDDKSANRRLNKRYAVNQTTSYRLATEVAKSAWKKAQILDMSSIAIRVSINGGLPVGTVAHLIMDWPGIYHGTDSVRLYLTGTVCRTGADGTVLRISSYKFVYAHAEVPLPVRRHRGLAVA